MAVVMDFIQSPTLDKLLKLKKEDLLAVGNELNIEVKRSMRKAQILRSIVKDLIECEDYPEDFNESVWEKLPPDPREIESDKVKLARIEAEKVMIEAEQARFEAESKERIEKERLEFEKFKFHAELQFKRDSDENRRNEFDLTKYVKLVPQFNESDVDKYFQHFEKIATNLHWPENVWSSLLQSALKGKAQETFAALSVDDSSDYDVVKAAILKAYELVPEAYRQKFRNYKKDDKQTYVEFANQTEVYFDRWCSAKKVISDYDKLRQIALIEQFKRCVHDDLKTYLDEKNVDTLHEMAVLADDYALTHKRSFKPRQGGYSRPGGGSGGFGGNNSGGSGSSGSNSAQASKSGASPSSNAGNKSDSPSAGTGGSSYGGSRGRGKNAPWSSRLTCHYCKIPGHVMSNCRRKMSDESKASPDVKPEGFISSVKPVDRTPVVEEITDHFDPKFDVREEYRPFVSVGSVSLVDSLSTPAPVKILRDTGATQTLLLKDTLPFEMSSATGESVIIQGVEGGFINVPLHRVNLVSDIVSGSVVVGVMGTLPAKGVSMLLGNDLAGGKVIAEPKVVMEPVTSAETEKIEEEIPGVFPSWRWLKLRPVRWQKTQGRWSNGKIFEKGTKTLLTTMMVSEIGTEIVVPTEANGISGQTGTGATERKQVRSARDEVIMIAEMIVEMWTDGAMVHQMVNHIMMLVASKTMPVTIEALTENSVMMTDDLDVTLMISMCLQTDLMNVIECVIDSKKRYVVKKKKIERRCIN